MNIIFRTCSYPMDSEPAKQVSQPNTRLKLIHLHDDILFELMTRFLHKKEAETLTLVCRRFSQLAQSHGLWYTLCKFQDPVHWHQDFFRLAIQSQFPNKQKQELALHKLYLLRRRYSDPWKIKTVVDFSFVTFSLTRYHERKKHAAQLSNGSIVIAHAFCMRLLNISVSGQGNNIVIASNKYYKEISHIIARPNGGFLTCGKTSNSSYQVMLWSSAGEPSVTLPHPDQVRSAAVFQNGNL